MARRTIFNATFCCGNMLQQFEVDCTRMHHAKAEINRAISQRRHFFMSTNKMAKIVDSEAALVDTFVPEARLDGNDRRKLIAFYKEKPIFGTRP